MDLEGLALYFLFYTWLADTSGFKSFVHWIIFTFTGTRSQWRPSFFLSCKYFNVSKCNDGLHFFYLWPINPSGVSLDLEINSTHFIFWYLTCKMNSRMFWAIKMFLTKMGHFFDKFEWGKTDFIQSDDVFQAIGLWIEKASTVLLCFSIAAYFKVTVLHSFRGPAGDRLPSRATIFFTIKQLCVSASQQFQHVITIERKFIFLPSRAAMSWFRLLNWQKKL